MPSKVLLAIVIGTILEYFDFLLFAHFGLIIAPLFFCDIDPIVCSLQGIGLLAIGFLMRPIGAIMFGKIGDIKGRKPALSFSVFLITLPTFIISLLPDYKTIGISAPFILILCRMAQGLSLGGEYTNAGVLLMELSPLEKRGFYSGILCASASVGCIIALVCAFIILYSDVPSWAWRVPFFLAAIFGFVSYKFRIILLESPQFIELQENKFSHPNNSVWRKIPENKIAFFITVAIGAFTGVLIWTPMSFTNFYLTKILEWKTTEAALITFLSLITYAFTIPFVGMLEDLTGKARSIMLWTAVLTIFLSYPLLFCLTHGYPVITQIGFGLLSSFFGASVHPITVDLYPTHKRCQSISFGFAIGMGLGGASPMIEVYFSDLMNDYTVPAFYVSLIASLGALAMYLYPSVKMRDKLVTAAG